MIVNAMKSGQRSAFVVVAVFVAVSAIGGVQYEKLKPRLSLP